ncbi:hypothetical protein ACFE04_013426 [Oxalis oulophora]
MGVTQSKSKDELLYQQVNYRNIQKIKSLHTNGAGLEWIDEEGMTPLIFTCMHSSYHNVAKTLIQLGANVNACRPGRHAGTPLHHAASCGVESTVKLLLSHGANALLINDDGQTALQIARDQGFWNIVRAIESHICIFSGWLREFYGPGIEFLEALAPKRFSRLVWVVIVPCGFRKLITAPRYWKLELAIYSNGQNANPSQVIQLWTANLKELKVNQPDPSVQIVDSSTSTRNKFAPANEGDRKQLQLFCDACEGIPQATPAFLNNPPLPPVVQATLLPKVYNDIPAYQNTARIPTPPQPFTEEINENAPIHYPSLDSNPINLSSSQAIGTLGGVKTGEVKEDEESSSSCVICWDAKIEGACVPCGHMCGCMKCLAKVKARKWNCPVCRVKIKQIMKVYTV